MLFQISKLQKIEIWKAFLRILLTEFSKTIFTPFFGNTMCLLQNSFSKVKLIFWWRRVFVENNRVKHCYPVGYVNDLLCYPKSSPKCPNSTRTRDEFVVLPEPSHQNRYSPCISPPEIPNNFPTANKNLPKIASEEVILRAFLPILPEKRGCATATDVVRSFLCDYFCCG